MTDKYRCRCRKPKTVIPGSPWADKVDNPVCPHCNNDKQECYKIDDTTKKVSCIQANHNDNNQRNNTTTFTNVDDEKMVCNNGYQPIPPLGIFPIVCTGNKKFINNNIRHTCWFDFDKTRIRGDGKDKDTYDFTKIRTNNRSCNSCKNAKLCTDTQVEKFLSKTDNSVCLKTDIPVPDSCKKGPNVFDQSHLSNEQLDNLLDKKTYMSTVIPEQCRKDLQIISTKYPDYYNGPCIFKDIEKDEWWCGDFTIR